MQTEQDLEEVFDEFIMCSRLTGQFVCLHCVISITTVRSDLIFKLPTKSSLHEMPEAQTKIVKWYRFCPTIGRSVDVNVDSTDLGFPHFNFLHFTPVSE